MNSRQFIAAFLAGSIATGMLVPRMAQASYGFIGQFTGGDCATSGPNSYSLTCTKIGGQTVGSLAFQAASALAATGGSVNGVTVGATTPATVTGTTLTNTGAIVKHITKITTGASYAALSSDNIIDVNKSTGSATAITLPASPVDGMEVEIKDKKGDAATNTITVSPSTGTIDGQSSVSISTGYGNGVFRYDGTAASWSLY